MKNDSCVITHAEHLRGINLSSWVSPLHVVWIYDTYENNFENNRKFMKYLKGICELGSD